MDGGDLQEVGRGEGEGGLEAAPPEAPRASRARERNASAVGLLKIVAVLGLLSVAVAALLGAFGGEEQSPFVYSQKVDVVARDPSAFLDRTLRGEGQLQQGSIRFREQPCEWRFVLEEGEQTMPVEFAQCVVPDTFRDGMGITVVVEGRLRADGSFVATQVIPRCPSRYEMEQRRQAGEAMPHS